jgi:tRNA U34 5-methylaminomethyl-2-thiouridine-forming methyltransferase MnmC
LKRELLRTADGSMTIRLPDWDEQYHSKHGAIAEARHVFIETGLRFFTQQNENAKGSVKILEIGFGTGLNAALTLAECQKLMLSCSYTGIEAFPVNQAEWRQLQYWEQLTLSRETFEELHGALWGEEVPIGNSFAIRKEQMDFKDIAYLDVFNLVYFDAFGPRVQPELWTVDIFKKMFDCLTTGGVLVTYSAKGSVRRAMQEVGFTVQRLPGPPGKREMLRATKAC